MSVPTSDGHKLPGLLCDPQVVSGTRQLPSCSAEGPAKQRELCRLRFPTHVVSVGLTLCRLEAAYPAGVAVQLQLSRGVHAALFLFPSSFPYLTQPQGTCYTASPHIAHGAGALFSFLSLRGYKAELCVRALGHEAAQQTLDAVSCCKSLGSLWAVFTKCYGWVLNL